MYLNSGKINVVIQGPAGSGKTKLARLFRAAMKAAGIDPMSVTVLSTNDAVHVEKDSVEVER